MLTTPTLIKRPVLESGDKLMLGFKAENYQTELLWATHEIFLKTLAAVNR